METYTIAAAVVLFCGIGVALFARAAIRSRRLKKQYRLATPAERASLDRAMDRDPDLEAHMRPLPALELALIAIFLAAIVVISKIAGSP